MRALIIAAIVVHLQMLTSTSQLTQSIPTPLMVQWLQEHVFPSLGTYLLGVGYLCSGYALKRVFKMIWLRNLPSKKALFFPQIMLVILFTVQLYKLCSWTTKGSKSGCMMEWRWEKSAQGHKTALPIEDHASYYTSCRHQLPSFYVYFF